MKNTPYQNAYLAALCILLILAAHTVGGCDHSSDRDPGPRMYPHATPNSTSL